jgi:hypothetical protein
MSALGVRREKAALSSGRKPHPQSLRQAAIAAMRQLPVTK